MAPPIILPPPFVVIPDIPNLRDAGGYPTSAGIGGSIGSATAPTTSVSKGLLYRSADPSRADPDGQSALSAGLGITTIFDLRSKPELERAGGAREDWHGGIQRVWTPVFEEADYSPERLAVRYKQYAGRGTEGFVQAYGDILSHGGPAFRTILTHIADTPISWAPDEAKPPACLVHCTAGKDRTGVFVALLLSMLGVDDETIAEEYSLTDAGLGHMREMFIERLMASPAFAGNVGRDGAERMVGSTKENMLATLAMIREKYGGAEEYMRTVCQLSSHAIDRIRQVMLVKASQASEDDVQKASVGAVP